MPAIALSSESLARRPSMGRGTAGPTRASLRGHTGPWANQRFPLRQAVVSIGRVVGNDVVFEDDSVSRRHAEIVQSGGGYVLRDVGSANGTFLNGERITEAPLVPGDVIKFGVVEVTYSGPSLESLRGAQADAAQRRRQRTLVAVGTATLALVVGAAVFQLLQPAAVIDHRPTGVRPAPESGTAALLAMCKGFSDVDGNTLDWSRAVDACQRVLTADPINVDARRFKKLAEKERAQKAIYEGARHLYDLGETREAMQEYLKIDSDSFYFRLTRSEFRSAAPLAMKNAGDLCLSDWKADLWDKAWPDCQRMMDVGSYLGLEASAQTREFKRAFGEVQKHFPHRTWVARLDYARFLQEPISQDGTNPLRTEAIRKRYPDPELAAAVDKYASDASLGMQAVQRYLGKGGKSEAEAKEAYRHMETAAGSHQSGYEHMLRFDLKGAAVPFHTELEADAKVLPAGFESDLSRQTRRDISEKFAAKGKELFQEGRLPESFAHCEGGAEFNLGNPSVLECFSDLENKAADLVTQGCSGAAQAAQITRSDSPTHRRAKEALKADGC